jgi:hypothetical protein
MKKIIFSNNYFKQKYSLIAISVVLFFVVTGLLLVGIDKVVNRKNGSIAGGMSEDELREKIDRGDLLRRKIDGVFVEKGKENLPVIAAMINNHIDARPTIGLAQANVVYEAEVEGGITRLMALYASEENLEEIGSIRSARPYFLEWVNEYDALYVHCGGSPEALVQIIKDDIWDLNEFYNGKYYWRDTARSAPHNIYTSTEKLNNYFEAKNIQVGNYSPWKYKDDLHLEARPASSSVEVFYRLKSFIVEWRYEKSSNTYARYVAGELQKEKNGEYLSAKNIIIQTADAEVLDEKLRLRMDVIGDGDAIVCMDGTCESGEWRKKRKTSRTRYFNFSDQEFEFNAGATWIQVVRPEIRVEVN